MNDGTAMGFGLRSQPQGGDGESLVNAMITVYSTVKKTEEANVLYLKLANLSLIEGRFNYMLGLGQGRHCRIIVIPDRLKNVGVSLL